MRKVIERDLWPVCYRRVACWPLCMKSYPCICVYMMHHVLGATQKTKKKMWHGEL